MSHLLTIQILVKDNEDTIEFTLESVLPLIQKLNAQLVIGDLGCTDRTIQKCNNYNAQIIRLSLNSNLSQARNNLLEKSDCKWYFQIEPYETILKGIDSICSAVSAKDHITYHANILQGDIITKQIRLWHKDAKLKFKNPVFETLSGNATKTEIYIVRGEKDNSDLSLSLASKWLESSPLLTEPLYYVAFANLSKRNWTAFLNYAEMYLHQEKNESMSVMMTRYYYSMVKCYIEKDYQSAIKSLLPCLANKPLMAEFWCLLGDIYYAIKQYDKSQCFYENAILLGSRRLKDDDWQLEISKYKEYPQKMIERCKELKQSLRLYFGKNL